MRYMVLLVFLGCGDVSTTAPLVAADADAAGAAAADAAGADGAASAPDAAAPDARACLDANADGFGLAPTCSGGAAASYGCHAGCQLNGHQFVGCVLGSPYASECYADCSACP